MDQDKIREAFQKAKQDIESLKGDIYYLFNDIQDIKLALKALADYESIKQSNQPTNQHINTPKHTQNPTFQHIPTREHVHYALKQPFNHISTGNDGVPTNQPTNQQTNQHPPISHGNLPQNDSKPLPSTQEISSFQPKYSKSDKISHLEQVSNVLDTLDNIKKEIRTKFKRLTSQEMLVFSSIYSLEDEGFTVDYFLLSQKLGLSEISIRDYIRKLIKKSIPIEKTKEDNKKVQLSVSPNLKKMASLSTILSLKSL